MLNSLCFVLTAYKEIDDPPPPDFRRLALMTPKFYHCNRLFFLPFHVYFFDFRPPFPPVSLFGSWKGTIWLESTVGIYLPRGLPAWIGIFRPQASSQISGSRHVRLKGKKRHDCHAQLTSSPVPYNVYNAYYPRTATDPPRSYL